MAMSKPPIAIVQPGLAANIDGVDVRTLDAETASLLLDLLVEHPLLVLPGQELEPGELATFAALFGTPQTFPEKAAHPDCPQVTELSNRSKTGQAAIPYWHVDGLLLEDPPLFTTFYALHVPPEGGDTLFADARGAWDALAPAERDALSGREAVMETGVRHPLVRMHPLTGRPAICLNPARTVGIVGATRDSAARLMDELSSHVGEPERVYRHRYQRGDLLLWDNYALAHSATEPVDPRHARVMLRCDIHLDAAG
jgi:taurine dioxygenase